MNYIDMINQIWILNREHCFKPSEVSLYFHLLDVSNSLGWKNPFKQGNLQIGVVVGISEPTLQRSREKLVHAGLIQFKSGKIKRELTEYTLIDLGIKKLYQSRYLSSTQSDTKADTKPYDFNKGKGKLNYISIQGEQIFEIQPWFESNFALQKPNWQKIFPLANIELCLDDFFLKKAFETFKDLSHFKNAFALELKYVQEKNEKEKGSGQKEKGEKKSHVRQRFDEGEEIKQHNDQIYGDQ
jgi:hypothetical protein